MKPSKALLAATLLLILPTLSASAQQRPRSGPYGWVEAGAALTDDIPVTSTYGPANVPGTMQVDTGFEMAFGMGYAINDYLAAEFQTGWTSNGVEDTTGLVSYYDTTVGNIPMLVNAVFRLPVRNTKLTPYVGGGAGCTFTFLDTALITTPDVYVGGSDSDVAFAWQAFAGLRYEISGQMSLGIVYRYFHSDGVSLFSSPDAPPISIGGSLQIDDVTTQSISLTFHYGF